MHEVGLGDGEGALQLRRPGRAVGPHENVVADRGREERGLLEGDGDLGAQRLPRQAGDVDAVEGDAARGHLVETGDERGEGGLAAAGGADQGHGLAGADVEVDVLEDGRGFGRGVGVAELDVVKAKSLVRKCC